MTKPVTEAYGPMAETVMFCRFLGATDKVLWTYLRRRMGEHGLANPSVRRMAADLNLGRRTIQRSLRTLQLLGQGPRGRRRALVNVSQRCGRGKTNWYTAMTPREAGLCHVCRDKGCRFSAFYVDERVSEEARKLANLAPFDGQFDADEAPK